MTPKISIITPCFNAEKHIEETILSIINQDYKNIEYIIIDGGSTDGTVDIIKKYESKISYWISEPDKGQSDAINKGIAKATGDIFNWINADDYLEDAVLKIIASEFTKGKIDILCTNTMLFNETGNIGVNGTDQMNLDLFHLLNAKGLNQMGMYWSLEKVKVLHGVNPAFNYSMDLDLFKRYLLTFGTKQIRFKNIITGYFRLSNTSKTGVDFTENFHLFDAENNAALIQYAKVAGDSYANALMHTTLNFKKELADLKPHSNVPKISVEDWLQNFYYYKAKRLFYANDFESAYKLLSKLPIKLFNPSQKKDLKYFKRWSQIRKWIH